MVDVLIRPRGIVTETRNATGDVIGPSTALNNGEILSSTGASVRNTTAFPARTRCVEVYNFGSNVVCIEIGGSSVTASATTSTPIPPSTKPVLFYAVQNQYIAIIDSGVSGATGTLPPGGTANQVLEKIDGTDYNTQWATLSAGGTNPTFHIYTSSDSIDIDNDVPGATMLVIEAIAGGGGGGGIGSAGTGGDGSDGGDTVWDTAGTALTAGGGFGGIGFSTGTGPGGLGGENGNGSPGTPSGNQVIERFFGEEGVGASNTSGGRGGHTAFYGGGGSATSNTAGGDGNKGGGGGAGALSTSFAAGGGAGESVRIVQTNLTGNTFSFTIGAGGTGGTAGSGGTAGGDGGGGYLKITAYYGT